MYYKSNKPEYFKRKKDTSTVGEAIQEMLQAYRLNARYKTTEVIQSWERLMGKPIAVRTEKVALKQGKLYVKLNSAPLKQELSLSRHKIADIFNREFGEGTVEEVILY